MAKHDELPADKKQSVAAAAIELRESAALYETDRKKLLASLDAFDQKYANAQPSDNAGLHAVRKAFDPIAEATRGPSSNRSTSSTSSPSVSQTSARSSPPTRRFPPPTTAAAQVGS